MSANFCGLIKGVKYRFTLKDGTWDFPGDAGNFGLPLECNSNKTYAPMNLQSTNVGVADKKQRRKVTKNYDIDNGSLPVSLQGNTEVPGVSREVPCSVLKCETVLDTLDATAKVPGHAGFPRGDLEAQFYTV